MDGDAGGPRQPSVREANGRQGAAADQPAERDQRDDQAKQPEQTPPDKKRFPYLRFVIFGVVLAVAAVGGVLWWLNARHYESTDDAFVDGHVSQVSPQIAGQVVRVLVDDNQQVKAGDLLVEIDPRDPQVKLEQSAAQRGNAAAQLQQAIAQVVLQQANLDQARANARVSEADLTQAEQDFARYSKIDPRAISKQQLDNANASLRSARAKLDAANQAVNAGAAQVKATEAQQAAAQASLQAADADVDNARLQLSYTKVTAPVDGWVTKRNVDVGNYVGTSTALMAIVPFDLYVTANFKETQLADMKIGQPVALEVDAFPNMKLYGKVQSFQAGTGTVFSTLPAENATGNYVKVVQRLPVKIVFDADELRSHRLAPGLSVVPRVTVR